MGNELSQILQKRWVHSHEEDTATEMVFRPSDFSFPRSRGRTGFELQAGNTLIEKSIAPTDATQAISGSWELDEAKKELVFRKGGSSKERRTLQIVSASPEKLVIRK